MPHERCRVEVINLRNTRPRETGRVAQLALSPKNQMNTTPIDALLEQVDSLRDTISTLEQRIVSLEDDLKTERVVETNENEGVP